MVFKEAKAILPIKCLVFLILKTDKIISQFVYMNMNFTPPNAFKIFVCPLPAPAAYKERAIPGLRKALLICVMPRKYAFKMKNGSASEHAGR